MCSTCPRLHKHTFSFTFSESLALPRTQETDLNNRKCLLIAVTSPDKTNGPSVYLCVSVGQTMPERETLKVYKSTLSADRFSSSSSPTGTNKEKTDSALPRLHLSLYSCCALCKSLPCTNPSHYKVIVIAVKSSCCSWYSPFTFFFFLLTRFEDLVADGEASAMRLVVRHKLDEELVPRGHHRRGSDLPTILPDQLTALIHSISHFHIVISAQREKHK